MNKAFDFVAHDNGSVWCIQAVSRAAKQFAKEHIAVEDWMGTPDQFSTDWRPARDLCHALAADGFKVAYRCAYR